MRKRIILLTMIAILAVGIECLAQTKTAYYNGGTVTYTLRRIGNASQDAGEATTGYDNPGYIQFASVCFLQALFGQSCKTFLDIIASPNWTKLQSLDWQLSCQPHSHCRPYLVVTA